MDAKNSETESLNSEVELSIRGQSFLGLGSYGTIEVGDAAFEYYAENNDKDFIQIPWEEIDYIAAPVLFNKWIARFVIYTKMNGKYSFSSRNNKKTLHAVRNHFPAERMVRTLSFTNVLHEGIMAIPHAIVRLFTKSKDKPEESNEENTLPENDAKAE